MMWNKSQIQATRSPFSEKQSYKMGGGGGIELDGG